MHNGLISFSMYCMRTGAYICSSDSFRIFKSELWYALQLVDTTWKGEMEEERILKQEHSGIDLGKKQALNEDYKESVFDRGHLNPNGHHAGNGGWAWVVFRVKGQ